MSRDFPVALPPRRVTASGRALIAVLALGLVFESPRDALAFPRVTVDAISAPTRATTPTRALVPVHVVAPVRAVAPSPRAAALASTPVRAAALAPASVPSPRVLLRTSLPSPRMAAHAGKAAWSHPRDSSVSPRSALLTPIARSEIAIVPTPRSAPSRSMLMARRGAIAVPFDPARAPKVTPRIAASTPQSAPETTPTFASNSVGGGKMIRVSQSASDVRVQNGATQNGASVRVAPLAPAAISPNFRGMKKVISVPSLSLPPLSRPLPVWMQNAAVKVDRLEAKTPKRVAQNPMAPPVRNPGAPVTNSDRLPNQIEVAVSTFVVLLTTTDLQTVAVADPGIADVAVVNARSVLLNGKSPGITSLVIVDGRKIRQYTVRVTATPGSRPVDVAAAIGLPGVGVRALRDALVLEGEVGSAEEARRAAEIAGIYSTRVINQLTIRGTQVSPEASTAAGLRDLINLPGVNVRVSGDTAVLTGTVETPQQLQEAEIIARTAAKNVVNLIKLPALSVEQVRESLGAVAQAPQPSTYAPGQMAVASPLSVREAGGQLILEGSVASPEEAAIALAAANRTGLAVLNRLQIRAAATADQTLTSQIAAAIGRPGVIVRGTAKRLVLEGIVADTNEAVLAEQVARGFGAQVDNLLRTPTPVQCNVDVSIVELNTNDSRQLGVQFGSVSLVGETITPPTIDPTTGVITNPGGTVRTIDPTFNQGVVTGGNGFVGGQGFRVLDPFRVRLNALIAQGKGRVLSNPSTTVLSGRTATFQVGGQVPIPAGSTTNAAGTSTSIVFKDFGILLDIVPNALTNGNVTLRVRTEVSQPDFSTGIVPPGGGGPIPGFRRRSTVTEVTVPPNGTVALSGLITSDDTATESRVPLLSRIPIIGSLFRSRDFRQNKTELVIFVRPRVLPNTLPAGTDAFTGSVAVGENTNAAAVMGNPGLRTFDNGATFGAAPAAQ
ncbi:MAG: BON domain-containing protein [Armatimonadetes bacterium]|nr:BON domain-containing protein [Armatimonadota bacterium]